MKNPSVNSIVERLSIVRSILDEYGDQIAVATVDSAATIISELQAENERLRAVAISAAAALGNGAALSKESSLQFIELLPGEVAAYTSRLRSSLSRIKAETIEEVITAVEQNAFQIMLDVVNEWHRQVGIDDVMKSKLTQKRADTVATGVFKRSIASAIRSLGSTDRSGSEKTAESEHCPSTLNIRTE